MTSINPSSQNTSAPPDALSISDSDLKTAGYIRLLSSILDEPAETVAIALKARLPVVAAITAEPAAAA